MLLSNIIASTNLEENSIRILDQIEFYQYIWKNIITIIGIKKLNQINMKKKNWISKNISTKLSAVKFIESIFNSWNHMNVISTNSTTSIITD
jgi:hypothetical protein